VRALPELAPHTLALLVLAALASGFVDAIAGGGGVITVPTLLAVGVPPHLALGTNKGQAIFGSSIALWTYGRAGLVDARCARATFPAGLVGALLGSQLVLWIAPDALRPIVIALLVGVAIFFALRPLHPARQIGAAKPREPWIAAAIAVSIGAYDGFFGPGTGTFLMFAFVLCFGASLPSATADAKVVNFASNLGAVALFAGQDLVLWQVALPMAAAQLAGAWLGAHTAIRGGSRWVRAVTFLVVGSLIVKLMLDLR
jgi:uncharacterized protein